MTEEGDLGATMTEEGDLGATMTAEVDLGAVMTAADSRWVFPKVSTSQHADARQRMNIADAFDTPCSIKALGLYEQSCVVMT